MHATPPAPRAIARHPAFRHGAHDMAPMAMGIGAWGLVTGIAMVKSGMAAPMAIFMSLTVYAGTAQLAAIPLMAVGSPVWVVWLAACCVNLRFVIFSAMWRNYFGHLSRAYRCLIGYMSGDVAFVLFTQRYPEQQPHPEQVPYFWGATITGWAAWQSSSIAGILLANVVPQHWGLGFAGVLALLGVLCSLLADRTSWITAAVAGAAAVAAFALPLKLNILLAVAVAVAVGLVLETTHLTKAGTRS
ncbi:MAG TPA: AzlC family ABC transporter permease [Burkholderiaceae bacterium]